jgi:hypothetical protein
LCYNNPLFLIMQKRCVDTYGDHGAKPEPPKQMCQSALGLKNFLKKPFSLNSSFIGTFSDSAREIMALVIAELRA